MGPKTDASAEASATPGSSRGLAVVAFLLLVTSLWLPWWVIRYEDASGHAYEDVQVRLFGSSYEETYDGVRWVTAGFALVALGLLFLRIAGRSWHYEPDVWRRHLGITSGLAAACALSTVAWPAQVPFFWGGRSYALENATGSFTLVAAPGLGWWLAVFVTILLGVAFFLSRRAASEADGIRGQA